MEFDLSKVYTSVNADELHEGDVVCVADSLSLLKINVRNNTVAQIISIESEDSCFRFEVGVGRFNLAYLVSPAQKGFSDIDEDYFPKRSVDFTMFSEQRTSTGATK